MSSPSTCIAILVAMNLFWSGSYAVIKYGLDSMDPIALVFWRLLFGLVILVVFVAIKGYSLKIRRGDVIRIVLAGLFLATSSSLTVIGIELSNATDASLLYVFEPVWGIILASLILRERMPFTTIVGLLLVLAGFLSLSGFDFRALFGIGESGVGIGNILMVIGLLAESLFTIVLKPVAKRCGAPVVFAGVLLVAVIATSFPLGMRGDFAPPTTGAGIFAIAYLSIICTALGYTLWVAIMRYIPINVMLFTIFIQPVAGMLIAAATLGEPIDDRIFLGGSMLLAGMATAVFGHMRVSRKRATLEDEPVTISP